MRRSSREAARRSDCSVENARVSFLTGPLSNRAGELPQSGGGIESSQGQGKGANATGLIAGRAASSRSVAGPRLSDGRPGPPPDCEAL